MSAACSHCSTCHHSMQCPMARRRGRRCASLTRLVSKVEKEEDLKEKAKKLESTEKQKQQQQTSKHTEAKEAVVTRAVGKAATRSSVILTRAARRRAGIPPPTPLFRGGASHLKAKASWQKEPSSSSSSSSSSSDEDESVKPLWVQCDHKSCQKWRKLQPGTKIDIQENWYCAMHPDPTYQSCDTPEEKCPVSRKRAFTFSKLSAGQLIWARLIGFPPWPALVSPDPWSDGDYISEFREGCIYHVEFLGKMRTHCWVPEEHIEPYHCQTKCSLGEIRKSKKLEYALSEADSFATLSDQERLSKCEYTENTVKVEDSKQQTQVQNPCSDLSQRAQVGSISTTTSNINRKRCPSNSNKTTTQVHVTSQPLRDETNVMANSRMTGAMCALSQDSTTGTHEDLFKTLGMGFGERSHMNLVANTLIQQIQAHVLAALNQYAVTSNTKPQRATPSVQRSSVSVGASKSNSSITIGVQQYPEPGPSSTNNPQALGVSPTSKLTQTSLELSPDNQVKLVTAKQAGPSQRKINHCHTRGKENAKRKRRSPLQQARGGKKTKKKGSSVEVLSPTIRDYFKSSAGSGATGRNRVVKEPAVRGAPQHIANDQEVPISLATGGSSSTFQSLEMEAESELLEIQTMLSMFDDPPATSAKDKPQDTHTEIYRKSERVDFSSFGIHSSLVQKRKSKSLNKPPHHNVQKKGRSTDKEPSLKETLVMDKGSSADRMHYSVAKPSNDMDIESILQEMNTIDDLLQDLSQAQVVPYSQ